MLQPRADVHVDAVGEVLRPRTEGWRSGEEHASLVAGEDRKRQSFSGEGRRDLADGVATLQFGSGSRGAVVLRVAAACDHRKQAKREYASGEARESDRIAHGTKGRLPRSHQPHSLEGGVATAGHVHAFAFALGFNVSIFVAAYRPGTSVRRQNETRRREDRLVPDAPVFGNVTRARAVGERSFPSLSGPGQRDERGENAPQRVRPRLSGMDRSL